MKKEITFRSNQGEFNSRYQGIRFNKKQLSQGYDSILDSRPQVLITHSRESGQEGEDGEDGGGGGWGGGCRRTPRKNLPAQVDPARHLQLLVSLLVS